MQEAYRIITDAVPGELEVKKSRFICVLKNVRSETDAIAFIDEIKKANRDARHNCSAFRIGRPGSCLERFSDDGEPQGTAGRPMLSMLQGESLYDVCAVVTRYFGGILLGTGGLLRAYSDSLRAALDASAICELSEGVRTSVRADYTDAARIDYMARSLGVSIDSIDYGENVSFVLTVPAERFTAFSEKVRELTAARSECGNAEPVFYYGGAKSSIYSKR